MNDNINIKYGEKKKYIKKKCIRTIEDRVD